MDYLNPIAPSVLQTPAAQKQAAAIKGRQIHRTQQSRRFTATRPDGSEQPVESAEEITPSRRHDPQDPRQSRQRRPARAPDDLTPDGADPPRLDLTA